MKPHEQRRYARTARRFRDKLERRAYRIVRGRLLGFVQRITSAVRTIDQSLWLSSVDSWIGENEHLQMLSDVYEAVGPLAAHNEFNLVRSRIVAGLKRENPLFDLRYFSRRWKRLMMAILGNPETADRVTKITETTRKQIREALSDAINQQLDIRKTAKLIAERVGGTILRSRALLIARTETTRAANLAAEMGAAETGIELNKLWIATADTRTRTEHRKMIGKKPIPVDEKFVVGGKKMKHPGDPAGGPENVINCRCTVSYVPVMRNGMPVPRADSSPAGAAGILSRIGGAVVGFGAAIADLFKHDQTTVNNDGE
nr:phage minor head protein [uncultured Arsenicibacter sp.]